ncbi:hypothetical protein OROHE_007233 [Orobanche hederae]
MKILVRNKFPFLKRFFANSQTLTPLLSHFRFLFQSPRLCT